MVEKGSLKAGVKQEFSSDIGADGLCGDASKSGCKAFGALFFRYEPLEFAFSAILVSLRDC